MRSVCSFCSIYFWGCTLCYYTQVIYNAKVSLKKPPKKHFIVVLGEAIVVSHIFMGINDCIIMYDQEL